MQGLLGTAQRHVEKAPLLGQGFGVTRVGDGHKPLLEAGDVHDGPLEALGPVEGGDLDGVGGGIDSGTGVGAGPGVEVIGGSAWVEGQELVDKASEFGEGGLPLGIAGVV